MPLFGNKEDKQKKKQDKINDRNEKKENRRAFRLEKIKEVTAKIYAVAAKRKWLFLVVNSWVTGVLSAQNFFFQLISRF